MWPNSPEFGSFAFSRKARWLQPQRGHFLQHGKSMENCYKKQASVTSDACYVLFVYTP